MLVEPPQQPDAQAPQRRGDRRRIRHLGARHRGRIGRIVAGQRIEQDGAVLRGPGHRSGGVQAGRQRDHAAARHQARRRLDAGDAAIGRRQPDRAAGVGPQRPQRQPGRHRRPRAGAGPAGVAPRVPGIARRRPGQVERRPADGELVGRQLAQHHRALGMQPPHRLGVLLRHVVGEDAGMRRGAHAGRLVDVLVGERNAEQRRAPAGHHRAFGGARRDQGLALGHQQEGVQLRVLASIRASSSFTSSTGDSRFAAISRPASAMVRKGARGTRHRPRRASLRGAAWRRDVSVRPWPWPSPWALPWPSASPPDAPAARTAARREAVAGGMRRPCRRRAADHAAWRRSARPPAARPARGRRPGQGSAPARRARAEAASLRG